MPFFASAFECGDGLDDGEDDGEDDGFDVGIFELIIIPIFELIPFFPFEESEEASTKRLKKETTRKAIILEVFIVDCCLNEKVRKEKQEEMKNKSDPIQTSISK
jgi:hypothetical protein